MERVRENPVSALLAEDWSWSQGCRKEKKRKKERKKKWKEESKERRKKGKKERKKEQIFIM